MSQSFLQRSSFDSWPIAKPLHRILAFLIDAILVLIIVFALMKVFKQPVHANNLPYFWLIAMWFWEAFFGIFTGSSPGKRFLSLEVYSPRYDGAPSPVQISIRVIVFWIGLLLLGIGVLPILSRRDHRGWHDLIAETLVVGTSRSNPSPMAMRFVPDIILILSLLLFSGIGARIFSTGLKNSQVSTYSLKNCDSPDALVKKTDNVILGLVLSPAFTNCWQAIETTNQNIKDARVFQLAAIARKYHHFLLIDKEARSAFYESEIKPLQDVLCSSSSKECNTARYLSSLHTGEDIIFSENYLADVTPLLKAVAGAKNLTSELPAIIGEEPDQYIQTLLRELQIGLEPRKVTKTTITSNNKEWLRAVDCIYRLDAGISTTGCDRYNQALYAVKEGLTHNLDPLDDFLASQARDFIYEELKALKVYFTASMANQKASMDEFMASYPKDALFFSIVAKK